MFPVQAQCPNLAVSTEAKLLLVQVLNPATEHNFAMCLLKIG